MDAMKMLVAPNSLSGVLLPFTVLLATVWFLLFKWRRRHLERLAAKLPGPFTLPVIGNAHHFIGGLEDVTIKLLSMMEGYTFPLRFWVGYELYIAIRSPEDLKIVLNSSKTLERSTAVKIIYEYVINGLFVAPVQRWKHTRRAINPVFHPKAIEHYFPVFNRKSQLLLTKLDAMVGEGQFDVAHLITLAVADITVENFIQLDLKLLSKEQSDLSDAISSYTDLFFQRAIKVWLRPDFLFHYVHSKELQAIKKTIKSLMDEVYKVHGNRQPRALNVSEDDGWNTKSFIDVLFERQDLYPKNALEDEILTMFIASSETSSANSCFALLMLAIHQNIQEEAYQEQLTIFGHDDRDVTTDDLNNMTYLDMILKETLRRFSTVPLLAREVREDIKLTTCTLPAGSNVIMSPHLTHMDPSLYPDPDKFDPERFNTENSAGRNRFAYIPFSAGPRNCMGGKYTMASTKIMLSKIIRRYHLLTDVKMDDLRYKLVVTMKSADGYKLRLELRSTNEGL